MPNTGLNTCCSSKTCTGLINHGCWKDLNMSTVILAYFQVCSLTPSSRTTQNLNFGIPLKIFALAAWTASLLTFYGVIFFG